MKHLARFLLLTVLAPGAFSQAVLFTLDGDSQNDIFGIAVSGAGDVNGDGYADLIVGAKWDGLNGSRRGSAQVFSGWDRSLLHTFKGDSANDNLGWSVSGAGDVNGDGFADLIVGAIFVANGKGIARVFSGVDGSILFTFVGDSASDFLGVSVSGIGDVNGDGFADMIVGASGDDNNGERSGSARVFSGQDGSVLYNFDGDFICDQLGSSVSGAGDVNGDGTPDLIIGVHGADNNGVESGSARVYSGADGSVLYIFNGDSAGDRFGISVSDAGDVNADGFDDLIVGAANDDNNGTNSGSARVFSGADGSVLYTFDGDSAQDLFGGSVSGAGDVNQDGFADLIVGATDDDNQGTDSGSARILSGADGSVLHVFEGDSVRDKSGVSVSDAGDVNGDGYVDMIVGAYGDDNNGSESGSARVVSGRKGLGTNYCGGNVNSSGAPAFVRAFGSGVIADNAVTLETRAVARNQFGFYMMSAKQGFLPGFGGSQGNLCLGQPIVRFAGDVTFSGPQGLIALTLDLNALPGNTVFQPGETWNFQLWYRDVNPNTTSNTSDGLAITFQ